MIRALEITSRIGCSLDCGFCPQTKLKTAYTDPKKLMAVEDFKKMLATVPKDVEVHGSGFAEPYLNPRMGEMLLYASRKGHPVHVYSTLVGLNYGQAMLTFEARPVHFRVHVPDVKAMVFDDDRWIRQHDIFLKSGLRSCATYMSMGPLTPKVEKYLNLHGITVEMPTMLSRAGNLGWQGKNRPIKGPIRCAMQRHKQNVLLPSGDVVGCCHLYSLEIILGNLLTNPYQDIEREAERWMRDTNPPESSPCRSCEWAVPL